MKGEQDNESGTSANRSTPRRLTPMLRLPVLAWIGNAAAGVGSEELIRRLMALTEAKPNEPPRVDVCEALVPRRLRGVAS